MPVHLTPGVYFETIDDKPPVVSGLRTDIAAFIGIAERGPVHQPVRVESFEQFQSFFGSFIENGFLAYCVKAFFENGGQICHVIRVAADPGSTQTSGSLITPQPADRFSSIVQSTAGFVTGAVVTVTQKLLTHTSGAVQPADRAASLVNGVERFAVGNWIRIEQGGLNSFRRIIAVDSAANRLIWNLPLDAAYDVTQTIEFHVRHQTSHRLDNVVSPTLFWQVPLEPFYELDEPIQFATGHAQAWADFLDANANPTLRIRARSPGSWGNDISVRVGHTHRAATQTRLAAQPADRSASAVQSVTGFTEGALARIVQDAAGHPTYRLVARIDAARRQLVWDQPLDLIYDLAGAADGTRPISLETIEFSLSVYRRGALQEIVTDLSMASENARYVVAAVKRESNWIEAEDLLSSSTGPDRLPDPADPTLDRGHLRLADGRDGLAALTPLDFTGDELRLERWGLRRLEEVDEVAMVAIPDIQIIPSPPIRRDVLQPPAVDPCLPGVSLIPFPEPTAPEVFERPPSFTLGEVALVQEQLIRHCEFQKDRIALLDPPAPPEADPASSFDDVQSWRQRFDSKYAALYFPWLKVLDPLRVSRQELRGLPPCGHIAGVYARSDLATGVHKAPANEELEWVQGTAVVVSAADQGLLNPEGINVIRPFAGRGIRVYGARTLSRESLWRFVNVRRLLMMIEEALSESLQWAVFENNDYRLRQTLTLAVSSFLRELWQRGALVGAVPDEAYGVKCDEQNNPPGSIELGQLVVDVALAPVKPAEFVIFRIGRTEGELRISERSGFTR
jgi:uncharacterized protein